MLKPDNATAIVSRFLSAWTEHTYSSLNDFEVLMDSYESDTPEIVWTRTFDTIQAYLLWQRQKTLDGIVAARGGQTLSPADVVRYNPSAEVMGKLNAICSFHKVHRVVIHLYLQAHLESQADILSELRAHVLCDLDDLVEELYQS